MTCGGICPQTGWEEGGWSYAEKAKEELLRLGISQNQIASASAGDTEINRTYQSAVAVRRTLDARSICPSAVTIFTLGSHARRSRLTFDKVYQGKLEVGVVGWFPPSYKSVPWWSSSERAREFIAETAGYFYEKFMNSGRAAKSAVQGGSHAISQFERYYTLPGT